MKSMKTAFKYFATLLMCASALFAACERTVEEVEVQLSIESVSPLSGTPGTEILINGTGFPVDPEKIGVTLGGVTLEVIACNEEQILAVVADDRALLGEKTIEVTIDGETVTSPQKFTYFDTRMYVASVSPASAGFGAQVTITGENFPDGIEGLSVSVNGVELTVVSSAPDRIVVAIPQNDAMGTGPVVVNWKDQLSQGSVDFTYIVSPIKISSIVPLKGTAGTEVTITGEGFSQGIKMTVNGVEFEVKSVSATRIVAVVPDNPAVGTGPVVLTDGTNTRVSEDMFEYEAQFTRTVSLLAGTPGSKGIQNGAGNQALFMFTADWGENRRCGLVVDDDGNLFVADVGNMMIRKITPDGTVSTFAGTYTDTPDWGINWRSDEGSYNPEFRPCDIAYNPVNRYLYVTDNWLGGTHALAPDTKTFYMGYGAYGSMAVDVANNRMYLSDNGSTVWMCRLDGTGADANNTNPKSQAVTGKAIGGMAVDPATGDLYVSAYTENRIFKYVGDDWSNPILVAGNGNAGHKDGPGAGAEFDSPWGLCFDGKGNLLVAGNGKGVPAAETGKDNSIRYINLASGMVTTFAGASEAGSQTGSWPLADYGGVNYQNSATKPVASFDAPSDVAVGNDGTVYVLSRGSGAIYKIVTEEFSN
jgi:sugar lactone lactonase YvrE